MEAGTGAEQFLNDSWSLYFHDPDNANWDMESYIPLLTVASVEDWLQAFPQFRDVWSKGMFFLMREHVLPIWEDENNRHGGCISFKLWKNEVAEGWFELACRCLGEILLKKEVRNEGWNEICGVSISPKRSYCIARIWLRSNRYQEPSKYSLHFPDYSKVMYKSHADNQNYAEGEAGEQRPLS